MPSVDRGGVAPAERAKAAPPPMPAPSRPQQRSAAEPMMAAAAPPPSGAAAADAFEATDAATQVVFRFPRPVSVANGARSPSRSSIARCRRSGWRSTRPTPRRVTRWRRSGWQRRRQRPAAGAHHHLRARQGRLRLLCRRSPPVGLPGRRDAAAGLCAGREDRGRARYGADRSHRDRHDRPGRAQAVARRAPGVTYRVKDRPRSRAG